MTQNLRVWLAGTGIIIGVGLFIGKLFLGGKTETKVALMSAEEAKGYFGVLPAIADNPSNPVTPEKLALGKALFFDPRLSKSAFISCNSCHNLAAGGVDGLPTSLGHRWQIGRRNAPTVLNAALQAVQFWDGRAADLEEQAGMPILGPGEMASSQELVLTRLRSISEYVAKFAAAFPGESEPLTYNNVAKAIAAFERTLLTPSRFDRFLQGNGSALSRKEQAGLSRFVSFGCVQCHNGVAIGGGSMQKFGKMRLPEGLKDNGRFAVTQKEQDRFVFKVPSLRNIALTAPYFHDGSVWTIEEATQIMADVQLGKKLSLKDAASIATFLKSLNADPLLEVALPQLPPSTVTTPRPVVN
ncbi:MAG: cytochrome-c peroxidase [Gammaproteobacteria bacterium]